MIVLAGGDLVLPDRIQPGASLILEDGLIAAIEPGRPQPAGAMVIDVADCYVVPGFIDVHVHGVLGHDTLDGGDAIGRVAALLPDYGGTALCTDAVSWSPAY